MFNSGYSSLGLQVTAYCIRQSFKDNTSPEIYRNKFFEFCDHYKDSSRLYTDGCRMENQVAAAVVYRSTAKTTRLPNTASILVLNCTLFHFIYSF